MAGPLEQYAADNNAAVLAAPGLFKLGGKTFILEPATSQDFGMVREWAADKVRESFGCPVALANRQIAELGKDIAPGTAEILLDIAFKAKMKNKGTGTVDPTPEQIGEQLRTVEAVRWFVLQRLKKASPADDTITAEWVDANITKDNLHIVAEALNAVDKPRGTHPN